MPELEQWVTETFGGYWDFFFNSPAEPPIKETPIDGESHD